MAVLANEPCYTCRRANGPVVVDGDISKEVWQGVPWSEAFVDIEGAVKPPPHHLTRVKMLHDDQYLYIAAEMEDPRVWGTYTQKNTTMYHENDFELFIDPDGAGHDYYELELNCLNCVWELRMHRPYSVGGEHRNPCNLAGLRSAVAVRGGPPNNAAVAAAAAGGGGGVTEGWDVELAVPIAELLAQYGLRRPCTRGGGGCDGGDGGRGGGGGGGGGVRAGDAWRVNFSRVHWETEVVAGEEEEGGGAHGGEPRMIRKVEGRPEKNWVWSPTGVIDIHRPERWAVVVFSDELCAARAAPLPPVEDFPARARALEAAAVRRALTMVCYDMRAARGACGERLPQSIAELYPWLGTPARDGDSEGVRLRRRCLQGARGKVRLDCSGGADRFVASARVRGDDSSGRAQQWMHVREDRLTWTQCRLPPGHTWYSWCRQGWGNWETYCAEQDRRAPSVPPGHTVASWLGDM